VINSDLVTIYENLIEEEKKLKNKQSDAQKLKDRLRECKHYSKLVHIIDSSEMICFVLESSEKDEFDLEKY